MDSQPLKDSDIPKIRQIEVRENISMVSPKLIGIAEIEGKRVSLMGVQFQEEARIKKWWKVHGNLPKHQEEVLLGNEVPDYFQDRLVGKRNICVRIGQKNVVRFYGGVLALFYVALLVGLFSGSFPRLAWVVLACLPISLMSYITGMRTYDNPYRFVSAIRYMIIQYVVVLSILITGYMVDKHFYAGFGWNLFGDKNWSGVGRALLKIYN